MRQETNLIGLTPADTTQIAVWLSQGPVSQTEICQCIGHLLKEEHTAHSEGCASEDALQPCTLDTALVLLERACRAARLYRVGLALWEYRNTRPSAQVEVAVAKKRFSDRPDCFLATSAARCCWGLSSRGELCLDWNTLALEEQLREYACIYLADNDMKLEFGSLPVIQTESLTALLKILPDLSPTIP
eukprot:TRINITY_DN10319_c0_g1_i1.p1 TRINITY_DN10319_c0_g1~~TRINITY_DN10319_c0_g1_i1.p1  ORF type:complete len:211 (-),score=23.96 TRINITY_DN10319_c0_g1_i1:11-574(-)